LIKHAIAVNPNSNPGILFAGKRFYVNIGSAAGMSIKDYFVNQLHNRTVFFADFNLSFFNFLYFFPHQGQDFFNSGLLLCIPGEKLDDFENILLQSHAELKLFSGKKGFYYTNPL